METQDITLEELGIKNIHPHYVAKTFNERVFGINLLEDD